MMDVSDNNSEPSPRIFTKQNYKRNKKRNFNKSNRANVTTNNIVALITKEKYDNDEAESNENTLYTDMLELRKRELFDDKLNESKILEYEELKSEAAKELSIRAKFDNKLIESMFKELKELRIKETSKALQIVKKNDEGATQLGAKEYEKGKQVKALKPKKIIMETSDAKAYAEDYDNKTLLQVCAICGIEDSPAIFTDITSIAVKHFADLTKLFNELTISLRREDDDETCYDFIYATQLLEAFDGGLLKGCHSVCGTCSRHISKKQKLKVDIAIIACGIAAIDDDDDDDDDDDSDNDKEDVIDESFQENTSSNVDNSSIEITSLHLKYPLVPKKALILGSLQVTVPKN